MDRVEGLAYRLRSRARGGLRAGALTHLRVNLVAELDALSEVTPIPGRARSFGTSGTGAGSSRSGQRALSRSAAPRPRALVYTSQSVNILISQEFSFHGRLVRLHFDLLSATRPPDHPTGSPARSRSDLGVTGVNGRPKSGVNGRFSEHFWPAAAQIQGREIISEGCGVRFCRIAVRGVRETQNDGPPSSELEVSLGTPKGRQGNSSDFSCLRMMGFRLSAPRGPEGPAPLLSPRSVCAPDGHETKALL